MMISIKYGSHFPVLSHLVQNTTGPMLELGVGLYSTPYLHWNALSHARKLRSYDNNEGWIKYFRDSHHALHEVNLITDWDTLPLDTFWDIAFIDHAPDERRSIDALRLKNNARFIVIHDSEPESDEKYHYSSIYPEFKYRFDYNLYVPNTTVLSNYTNLSFLDFLL